MTGVDEEGGGIGVACPFYSVGPYQVVRVIYVVQGVLCRVFRF